MCCVSATFRWGEGTRYKTYWYTDTKRNIQQNVKYALENSRCRLEAEQEPQEMIQA